MLAYGRPVQAAVSSETRRELEELADAAGLSLSAFVRQILEEYTTTEPKEEL